MSGDPCPVVKYEWLIQRLDGMVAMDWLNRGGIVYALYKIFLSFVEDIQRLNYLSIFFLNLNSHHLDNF